MGARVLSFACRAGALVPTTATVLRFAREGVIPGVLPTRGGTEWAIVGGCIHVRPKSFTDPESETREAVDYLWSFRDTFGRRRRAPSSDEVAAHRHAYRERLCALADAALQRKLDRDVATDPRVTAYLEEKGRL